MKDFENKFIYVLAISLAIYFAVATCIIASIIPRLTLADIQLVIPGALILIGTTVLWLTLLRRYPTCRRKVGVAIFFLLGLSVTAFISVAYPVLKTGALWDPPGGEGGGLLFLIIFLSLASQLVGFVAGFIPAALFIRRKVGSHDAL